MKVTYYKSEEEQTLVNLLSGTLKVEGGRLIFNFKVGISNKQSMINGTVNL